jgi:ribosomal protein L3 glutamine methyltransferase
VLDLCTGSGCLGIALAAYLPDVDVDLADISPAALRIAARNRTLHGLEDRVRIIESDLFAGIGQHGSPNSGRHAGSGADPHPGHRSGSLDLGDRDPANWEQVYDVIVSNPPYVGAEEMESLPAEYLHEPRLALAAGETGLDLVLRILRDAPDYLNDEGILVVEVGNTAATLQGRFPDVPFTWLDFERGGEGCFCSVVSNWLNIIPNFPRRWPTCEA